MKRVVFEKEYVHPPKIFCVGRNYVKHIEELNNTLPSSPVIFIKPNVCICQEDSVEIDFLDVRYEGEISFLLKNSQIIGAAFGIDFTDKTKQDELKKAGLPWEKAKAFRNSAVFSEFVAINSVENLSLELYLNEKLKQKGSIKEMINRPEFILKDIAIYFDIEDFDIVMSGTPEGVGSVKKGDIIEGILYDNEEIISSKKWRIV